MLYLWLLLVPVFGLCWRHRGGGFLAYGFHNAEPPITSSSLFARDASGFPFFQFGGTQFARLFGWVFPVTGATFAILWTAGSLTFSVPQIWGLSILPLMLWLGTAIIGHGAHMDGGTGDITGPGANETVTLWMSLPGPASLLWQRQLFDFCGLLVIGASRALIYALPFVVMGYYWAPLWLVACGSLFYGLGYMSAWAVPSYRTLAYASLLTISTALVPFNHLLSKFSSLEKPTDIGEFWTGFGFGLGLVLTLVTA